MKRIILLSVFASLFLFACHGYKPNAVLVQPVGSGPEYHKDPVTAGFKKEQPEKGSHVFVLLTKSSADIVEDDSKYPQKDTAWYEGTTFFQIKEGIVE